MMQRDWGVLFGKECIGHLLDEVVQVLGDFGRQALRLQDAQDGAAVHRLDLHKVHR